MKRIITALLFIMMNLSLNAGESYPSLDAFPNMGDYTGRITAVPESGTWQANPELAAQVIYLEGNRYRVRIVPELKQRCTAFVDVVLEGTHEELDYTGNDWAFSIKKGVLDGRLRDKEDWIPFVLERKIQVSPTMGAEAPDGAVILFDGSSLDSWVHEKGEACTWHIVDGEIMEIEPRRKEGGGLGDAYTKKKFGDCRLHIEFRYPVEDGKSGQGLGNSGVYFMGMGYEVQILNTYGLDGLWNECGAIYKVAAPKVNAAAPPAQWQTYDITFRAPRFDDAGKKVENARISVLHNGIPIHTDQEIPYLTSHRQIDRLLPEPKEPQPIMLQDHSNRIQFRNIWVVPLDE